MYYCRECCPGFVPWSLFTELHVCDACGKKADVNGGPAWNWSNGQGNSNYGTKHHTGFRKPALESGVGAQLLAEPAGERGMEEAHSDCRGADKRAIGQRSSNPTGFDGLGPWAGIRQGGSGWD